MLQVLIYVGDKSTQLLDFFVLPCEKREEDKQKQLLLLLATEQ